MRTTGFRIALTLLLVSTALSKTPPDYRIGWVGPPRAALEQTLRQSGCTVEPVGWDDFVEGRVSAQTVDCLLFTQSCEFPYTGRDTLLRCLRDGVDLITLAGHAFSTPLYPRQGQWLTARQWLSRELVADTGARWTNAADIDPSAWTRDADTPNAPSGVSAVTEDNVRCLRFNIRGFSRWDTFRTACTAEPAHSALVLRLKGSPNLRQAVIEIREKDGSRWVAAVNVGPDWNQQVVLQTDFAFLPDGSPAGRGKNGDTLSVANTAFIQFGMSYDFSPHKSGDYTLFVERIGTARVNLPEGFGLPLFDKRLPIFSDEPFHRIEKAAAVRPNPDCTLIDTLPGYTRSVSGVSAIGYIYPGASSYLGILDTVDAYDRRQGFAAGLLSHFDGPYKQGQWLLYGLTDDAFYASDLFLQSIRQAIAAMRQPAFLEQLRNRNAQAEQVFAPYTQSQRPALKRTPDGRHFVDTDGKPFFMLGVNYIGSFDCKTSHADADFVYEKWERDFRKAHAAGINCMRLWVEGLNARKPLFDSILHLADKYNIYLLLHPTAHPRQDGRELTQLFDDLSQLAAGEPMVIGYDLMNEPYITTVGSVRMNARPADILRFDAWRRYARQDAYDAPWVDSMAQNRTGWPPLSEWTSTDEARSLLAAYSMLSRFSEQYILPKDYSSLYGLPIPPAFDQTRRDFWTSVDKTFADWIALHESIRTNHPGAMVTVGYNTLLTMLPANAKLDFVSHHLYQPPVSYADLQKAMTTFDRLHALWPDKPITLGEFGSSCRTPLPDGTTLDMHNAAVTEMMIWLYAWANGFDGAMSWMLSDWPVALMDYSAPWISKQRRTYESAFGMYCYDGTPTGAPKPIVCAVKAMRRYMDLGSKQGGRFELVRADTQTGAGYVYRDTNALFVGMQTFENEAVSFKAAHAANVMLYWTDTALHVVASADADVAIKKDFLKRIFSRTAVRVEGLCRAFRQTETDCTIELLAGQPCILSVPPKP